VIESGKVKFPQAYGDYGAAGSLCPSQDSTRISSRNSPQPAALLLALVTRIEKLKEKIAALRRNSGNSSKALSSDRHNPNKPEKKKRRGRGKRRPGGQKGHPGGTLERVADPT